MLKCRENTFAYDENIGDHCRSPPVAENYSSDFPRWTSEEATNMDVETLDMLGDDRMTLKNTE